MIKGELVGLRPVLAADLPLLEAWENDVAVHGEYNMFGLRPVNGMAGDFGKSGFLDDQQGMLMVVKPDGEVVGAVSYHTVAYGPNSGSRTYNFGISLLPEQRGKGYGSGAQRLLAAYLFDTYPIARVEASTDITNVAEQRSLEKAGFTRDGVLRKAQWRSGAWHDLAVYSKLRGE
ncbi:MAG: GNAT family N-acetyltransferase [Chloroflexales bacterium]|nr:GNAT family N-acetyltransferase [Chloroflexales bacterium]